MILIFNLMTWKRLRDSSEGRGSARDEVFEVDASSFGEVVLGSGNGRVGPEERVVVGLCTDEVQLRRRRGSVGAGVVDHRFAVVNDEVAERHAAKSIEVACSNHFFGDKPVDLVVHAVVVYLARSQVNVGDFSDTVVVVEHFGVRWTGSDDGVFTASSRSRLDLQSLEPCFLWIHGGSRGVEIDIPFVDDVPDLDASDRVR